LFFEDVSTMTTRKFKENDRVRRIGSTACPGTVKGLRTEITATTPEARERGLLVSVLWDNGTMSYFSPEALEHAESAS
jgi:hypothetical protein